MKYLFSSFLLFSVSALAFAESTIRNDSNSITIIENNERIFIELIDYGRAERLRNLYTSRYNYVYFVDSISYDMRNYRSIIPMFVFMMGIVEEIDFIDSVGNFSSIGDFLMENIDDISDEDEENIEKMLEQIFEGREREICFLSELIEIQRGEYRIGSIDITGGRFTRRGIIYFGYNYFFTFLYTNNIDLTEHARYLNTTSSHEMRRFQDIFRSSWDMLIYE